MITAMDDGIEQLEIYAEFLGTEEFDLAKANYEMTLSTMEKVYNIELDRLQQQFNSENQPE